VIPFSGGHLRSRHWKVLQNLICLKSVGSSNDLARELIDLYFEEDQVFPCAVIVAEEQPEARGRRGDSWRAPRGRGLYWTVVREVRPGEPLSLVPIAFARWVCDTLREETGVAVELKWPNDLYVGRRKIAGVLSDSRTQGEETYLAVGVGLNVLGSPEELGVPGSTTIEAESGRPFPLAPLLQALLDRFDRELAAPRWDAEVRQWERASLHRPGDLLLVRGNGQELSGRYAGLSPEGFLRLTTPAGETVVSSGELARW
jgi:BirA family biotin operon repressor/biotin-[acetyl-CoA-carboxylase] ligase